MRKAYPEGDPRPQQIYYWRKKFKIQDDALQAEESEWEYLARVQDTNSPERAVMRAQTEQELDDLITRLPVDKQRIVRLYYQEGLTSSEIAELLEMLPTRVLQQLNMSISALRADMSQRNITLTDLDLFDS